MTGFMFLVLMACFIQAFSENVGGKKKHETCGLTQSNTSNLLVLTRVAIIVKTNNTIRHLRCKIEHKIFIILAVYRRNV